MRSNKKMGLALGSDLTAAQMMFVREYLIDFNGAAAARRAGYNGEALDVQVQKLLKTPAVQDAIVGMMKDRCQRLEVTGDMIVAELAKIAFSDITELTEWTDNQVTLKESVNLPTSITRAIAEVSQAPTSEGMAVRVRMYDKMAALSLLAKHTGVIGTTKHIHTGADGGPIQYQNLPVSTLKDISKRLIEFQKAAVEAGN